MDHLLLFSQAEPLNKGLEEITDSSWGRWARKFRFLMVDASDVKTHSHSMVELFELKSSNTAWLMHENPSTLNTWTNSLSAYVDNWLVVSQGIWGILGSEYGQRCCSSRGSSCQAQWWHTCVWWRKSDCTLHFLRL
jgi:hypothetical protein